MTKVMYNKIVRMKAERLRRGWTQQDLAFFSKVSLADVSRIETGRMKPYRSHAQRLAEILNLKPHELQMEASVDDQ